MHVRQEEQLKNSQVSLSQLLELVKQNQLLLLEVDETAEQLGTILHSATMEGTRKGHLTPCLCVTVRDINPFQLLL